MTPLSVTYSASGDCAAFTFDFPVMEAGDLEVLLNGVVQTSGFTLLGGEGARPGGAIRFDTAPAAGAAVTIRRTGRVQVSGSDAPGFLEDKIVAGSHITVTKTFDAAGEHLSIATDIDPAQFQPRDPELDWLAANLSGAGKALVGATDAAAQRSALGLAAVASSGSYNDLINKPVLGSAAAHDAADFAAAADISVDERNILRQALTSAVHGGYEAEGLFSGWCDAFNADTIGANSSGQSYVGSDKYYAWSPLTNVAIGKTATASSYGTNHPPIQAFLENTDGWASGQGLSAGQWVQVDLGTVTPLSQINFPQLGNYGGDTVSLQGSIDGSNWTTIITVAESNSDPLIITSGISGYRHYRCYWNGNRINNYGATMGNLLLRQGMLGTGMALVSNALSPAPASAPTKVRMLVLWKDLSGSAVLNTDFIAEATRDGTTWSAGTLADSGFTISGFKVLWVDVDVAAQPAGTAVKYRLRTLNSKAQQVKGVAYLIK